MLAIRPCPTSPPAELWQLQVLPTQQPYVLPIEEQLAQQRSGEHFQLLYQQDELVGCFILDSQYSRYHEFAGPKDLGLRGFFIAAAAQGKGYGKAALQQLPGYVQQHFSQFQRLILTVNCRNMVAHQLYLATGFQDSGSLYYGGPSGPQHIIWREL
ncbi:MAG: GNAT family N-acetyltransferase [Alkalimonas sp.]|nr:GNAT family N-acetyltransferase [Alkalimonas sp.]